MRYFAAFLALSFFSCTEHVPPHAPVGGKFSQEDLQASQNRTKQLRDLEKAQIEEWIAAQEEVFFVTPYGYWTNDADLFKNNKKADGEAVSFSYEIYDFDLVKLYDEPVLRKQQVFGRFEELKPIENALRYLQKGETVKLLIPSTLAYGTSGDGDRITNDLPIIIQLKML